MVKTILIILGIICFFIQGFKVFPTGRFDLGWIGAGLIGVSLLL